MANTVAPTASRPSPATVDGVPARRQLEQQIAFGNCRRLLNTGNTRKRFDSGDWCLARVGLMDKDSVPLDVPVEKLSPKLYPEPDSQSLPRSRSFLLRSSGSPSFSGHQ